MMHFIFCGLKLKFHEIVLGGQIILESVMQMQYNSKDEDSDDSSSTDYTCLECERLRIEHHYYVNPPDGLRDTIT